MVVPCCARRRARPARASSVPAPALRRFAERGVATPLRRAARRRGCPSPWTRVPSTLRPMRTALLLAVVLVPAACQSPDPRASRSANPAIVASAPTFEEQVRALAAGSQPSGAHLRLDPLAGDWRVTLSDVGENGKEVDLTHGTARLAWTHGGRFLSWQAELEGTGTTSGFLGFDLRHDEYQLLMISSLSSGMGVASGHGDLSGSGIRFTQETLDLASDRRLRMTSSLRLI